MNNLQQATLGGGCFWCIESFFNELKGVTKAISGYSGGNVPGKPTYREICSGLTGHAEVIRINFDADIISFKDLLLIFFTAHDPTTLNKQGADTGTQYRSVIFHHDEMQKEIANDVIKEVQSYFEQTIVTEVSPLINYYDAEEEHQNYYKLHPNEGYCSYVITPKITKLREIHQNLLKPSLDIIHQKEQNRFVLNIDGAIAKVDYQIKNDKMYLVHSEVPESLRGQGIGKKLVLQTFEKLTQEGYTAVAICRYIKSVAQRSDVWKNIIE